MEYWISVFFTVVGICIVALTAGALYEMWKDGK